MSAAATLAGAAPDVAIPGWHSIDWMKVWRNVRRLQARIVKATREGRWNKVRALVYLLTHSYSGRAAAILRVAFPCGEATGLPRSAAVTVWVRSRLSAGGTSAALEEFGASRLGHLPFWSKRVSILRLSCVTTVTTLHLS